MICLVSGALPAVRCGVGDYTDQLAAALARAGEQVVVITTADPRILEPAGYRAIALQTRWALSETPRLSATVRRLRPDVVDVQYPGVNLGRGFAATMLPGALRLTGYRGRLVTTLHEFDSLSPRQRVRVAVGAAAGDVVLAPDDRILRSIRRYTAWRPGLRVQRTMLGPNILPPSEPGARPLRRHRDELVVGYWGFLRPDKGVETLLEAFALVRRRRRAILVLAGDAGVDVAYAHSIVDEVERRGLADDVVVTGDLAADDLSATLLGFDVCALPYRDGLADNRGTYLAARAHGLYIVTTSRERLGFDPPSHTAFTQPGDVPALAEAILAAPDHPRRRVTLDVDQAWDRIAAARLTAYGAR